MSDTWYVDPPPPVEFNGHLWTWDGADLGRAPWKPRPADYGSVTVDNVRSAVDRQRFEVEYEGRWPIP